MARAVCFFTAMVSFCSLLQAAPPSPAQATDTLSSKVAASVNSVAKDRAGAVARVRSKDTRGEVNGSGFFIDSNGTLCTLAELVQGSTEVTIIQAGREFQAQIAAIDPRSGVAFLKVGSGIAATTNVTASNSPANTSFITPGPLTKLPLLTPVLAI